VSEKKRKKKAHADVGKKLRRLRESEKSRRPRRARRKKETDEVDTVKFKPGSARDHSKRGA